MFCRVSEEIFALLPDACFGVAVARGVARPDLDLGMTEPEPVAPGEVVYADGAEVGEFLVGQDRPSADLG
jgi:hypothetical protein